MYRSFAYLGPRDTSVTLEVSQATKMPIFVDEVVDEDTELLLPLSLGEERNISLDDWLVVVRNLGDDGRARPHSARRNDVVYRASEGEVT